MKILIIEEEFPYPLNSGKRLRTVNLTKALSKLDEVTYLAYGVQESESFQGMKSIGVNPVAVPPIDRRQQGLRFYWKLLANLLSPLPYIVTSHFSRAFQNAVHDQLNKTDFDVVIAEWTPYAIFIREVVSARKIIVAHNIEASIWRRYYENERNPFRRAYIALQSSKVTHFERQAFTWVDGATAVSRAEADVIRGFNVPYDVAVIDNGVDLSYFRPGQAVPRPHSLVFTGAMDWRPNQDAVLYFVQRVLPLIRKQISDVTFVIVGRQPPERVRALAGARGVTVTGTVEDVRPYIDQAALYVVPLRIGGGSRLKILEAMAMQKPVISTSIGAEGLRVSDKENILLYEDAPTFAEGVIRLLQDEEEQRRLAAAGRALVEREYGWEQLGRRLHDYLSRITSKP